MTQITILTSKTIQPVSPMLYGIFFEDINYAGDGGLYGELIANRSFEYYDREGKQDKSKMCWETVGDCSFQVRTRFPLSKVHSHYAHLSGTAGSGLRNLGFCGEGMAVQKGQDFRFSCYARNSSPVRLCLRLADRDGNLCGEKKFTLVRAGRGWTEYHLTITAAKACKSVYPEILLETEAALDLDLISLFPADTFAGRSNGMRRDLAEMLKALSPKFMRFPGGCIVEGRSFENMYRWKDTVGPLTQRPTNWNRWQMEEYQINGQSSEDCFQSYGIGFYEYFCLCEDLGAKPVPVMNAGMTCQWHEALLVDPDRLTPWIQDVLELIEFANGPADTPWGAKRAAMGHPKPFGLEYIGIGNEQWGEVYFERYEIFERALREKHPEIRLITCAGWTAEGEEFETAYRWMAANKDKAYAVDEHFYKSPEWFLENIRRYDSYDRTLPKVFAGEYAAHTHQDTALRSCNWRAALCEAAFLTGLEKNADHVVMSCYAPLFGRTGHQQWQPDLIWFDNDSAYGTPSYYVQLLFSNHVGTRLAETEVSGLCAKRSAKSAESSAAHAADAMTAPAENLCAADFGSLAFAAGSPLQISSTVSEDGGTLFVKLVNLADTPQEIILRPDRPIKTGTLYELAAELEAVNSHETPLHVSPVCRPVVPAEGSLELSLKKYSVTVLELGI
ncbi:MAG: alpha-L-arabinofuranosidase [bacterium]|nr:alpha-L-arabinofuranosidase [bacterium]